MEFRSAVQDKANRRLQDAGRLGTCDTDMDIACPNCAATYRVPEALLAQGKPLRCAACGETWVPELPPAPAVEEAPPAEPPVAEIPAAEAAPAVVEAPAPEAAALAPEPTAPPPDAPPPALPPETPPVAPPARHASPASPPPLNPLVLQRRTARAGGRRRGLALGFAWAASLATVLLALAGLVFYSDVIAAAWPPFARVTTLLGG